MALQPSADTPVDEVRWQCGHCSASHGFLAMADHTCVVDSATPQFRRTSLMKGEAPPDCAGFSCSTPELCVRTHGGPFKSVWDQINAAKRRLKEWHGLRPVHIFRIPKTGTTHLMDQVLPVMGCRTVVHDHGLGGLDLAWISGMSYRFDEPNEPALVTIREPCERFVSQYAHLKRLRTFRELSARVWQADGRAGTDGTNTSDPDVMSMDETIAWLQRVKQRCAASPYEVHCFVRAINQAFPTVDRVLLWPQGFYFPQERGVAVCYDRRFLVRRFTHQINAVTSCNSSFEQLVRSHAGRAAIFGQRSNEAAPQSARAHMKISESQCAAITRLYGLDNSLWKSWCGQTDLPPQLGNAQASRSTGVRWAPPTAA